MPDIIRLVYASTVRTPVSALALLELLARAQAANADLDITGALLYHDLGFVQVLEGPEAAVDDLYTRIVADPRHYGVTTLARSAVADRVFSIWSMGWVVRDELPIAGFDPALIRRARFGDRQVDALIRAFRLCVRLDATSA